MAGEVTKKFEAVIGDIKSKMSEIVIFQREANIKTAPLYWDVGKMTVDLLKSNADLSVNSVAEAAGCRKQMLYTATKMAAVYTRKDVEKLAERGLSISHLECTSAVDDATKRKRLEDRASDEKLSVDEMRKAKRELMTIEATGGREPGEPKEKKSKGGSDAPKKGNSPAAIAARTVRGMKEFMDNATDLIVVSKNIDNIGADDAAKLLEYLEQLVEGLSDLSEAASEIKPLIEGMVEKAKTAKKG